MIVKPKSTFLTYPKILHIMAMMKIAAVIFDLDGTITKPYLDFDRIRAEIGEVHGPLLEAMETMNDVDRQRAEEILHRHERDAAERSQLNPYVPELLRQFKNENRQLGIVTRNRLDSVRRVCHIHHLEFDGISTRQDGPAKPHPFSVLHVCEQLNVTPQESVVVGDYLFDLQSARRAGATSVLYRSQPHSLGHEDEADFVIDELNELPHIIAILENGRSYNPPP